MRNIPAASAHSLDDRVTIRQHMSIKEMAANKWDALVESTDYYHHAYLVALENSDLPGKWIWLGAYLNNELVAGTFGFIMELRFNAFVKPKAFLLGSPVNVGLPFACKKSYDDRQRTEVFSALIEVAQQHAEESLARLSLLRDFYPDSMKLLKSCTRKSDVIVSAYKCAYLELKNVKNMKEYLGSLRGQSAKKLAKQSVHFASATYEVVVLDQGQAQKVDPNELLSLWMNVYQRKSDPDQIELTSAYFRELCRLSQTVLILLKEHGRIVAFDLCRRSGDRLDSIFCGHGEIEGGVSPNRYMGLKIIEYALTHKCHLINFGISNEQVKKEMGCHLVPIEMGVRARGQLMKLLMKPALRYAFGEASKCAPKNSDNIVALNGLPEQTKKVIVIGAGLSGLAAAARLTQKGYSVEVLDAAEEIGGQCRQTAFPGTSGFYHTGCNLFQPKFFRELDRQLGIRIPTRKAPVVLHYAGITMGPGGCNLLTQLTKTVGVVALSRCILRLGRLWRMWSEWRHQRFDEAVRFVSAGSKPLADLMLYYAEMNGLSPAYMRADAVAFLVRELEQPVYPKPGLRAVPQALARAVTKQRLGRIMRGTEVVRIVRSPSGRVSGVMTKQGLLNAEFVVSTLAEDQTANLLGDLSSEYHKAAEGSPIACVALTLSKGKGVDVLPLGIHTFSFVTPDESLPSFDVITPGNLNLTANDTKLKASIMFNCAPDTANADQLVQAIIAHIDASYPGFRASIIWQKVILPKEYQAMCGFRSVTNHYRDPGADEKPGFQWKGVPGVYQTRRPAPLRVFNSETALQVGLQCANTLIEEDANESQG